MSRRNPPAAGGASGAEAEPRPLAAALLLGAVAGTLLLGAVLHAPAGADGSSPAGAIRRSADARDGAPLAAPDAGTPTEADRLARLGRRAEADLRRLVAGGEPWTAQLALLCDVPRVESMLASFGELEPFHVVPTYHQGAACFLACWSHYPTSDAARAARDLPPALRAIAPRAFPKRLAEIEQALR